MKDDFLCPEVRAEDVGLVIFGASGDLTHKKLLIALYRLFRRGLLPEKFYIIGVARSLMDDDSFRDKVRESIIARYNYESLKIDEFVKFCFYIQGSYDNINTYRNLSRRLYEIETKYKMNKNRVFYLAVPPLIYCIISKNLSRANLNKEMKKARGSPIIVVEKPFGYDLESAMALDKSLKKDFMENQIYRMDHYLGKETVQNILMFRFANIVFEPIWNYHYIDNIQITVSESIGVGKRAGYFDRAGQLRDIFQNHMMQMLSIVAMEPPISFDADRVRDEKVKLLRSIRPYSFYDLRKNVIRAQYSEGIIDSRKVKGYQEEEGVRRGSLTETFVAAKLFIDNWRWQGVPFYFRTGKRLEKKLSKIVIVFKNIPHSIFIQKSFESAKPNILVFNVQPDEGVSLMVLVKSPRTKICMSSVKMEFSYKRIFNIEMPNAYERLLLDCMARDQSLFVRFDDMKQSWTLFTPILKAWENKEAGPLYRYPAGSWGPKDSLDLLIKDNKKWF